LSTTPPPFQAPTPRAAVPSGLGPPWLRGLLVLPYALVVQVLVFVLAALLLGATEIVPEEAWQDLPRDFAILGTAASYLLVVPAVWLAWIVFDRASLTDLGHGGSLPRVARDLGLGTLGGVLIMSLVVGLGVAAGAWTLGPGDGRPALEAQAWWVPGLLLAAYFEELLLRGYSLQDLGRRSAVAGLAGSSVLFALLHGANPNLLDDGPAAALLALANIFLAGVLLGALFLASGRLWLPTGVHLGWNWTTAVLFGLPVSGFDLPSFVNGEAVPGTGPLSGGAFGPEASLPALAVVGPIALGSAWWVLSRGRRVPVVERHAPCPAEPDIIPEPAPPAGGPSD
jgi:membrane protease YdiL (CAAX protease family)